jgi:hypothetical protein
LIEYAKGFLIFISLLPKFKQLCDAIQKNFKEAEIKRKIEADNQAIEKDLKEKNAQALHDLFMS